MAWTTSRNEAALGTSVVPASQSYSSDWPQLDCGVYRAGQCNRYTSKVSTPSRLRDPSQSSFMERLLTLRPPVILEQSTTLFRRPVPFCSHRPMISSVAPSGRKRSEGMGYCSAVSIKLMPAATPRSRNA